LRLPEALALNSKANGKIVASGLVEKLFVQPAASDDGVALGAALAPYLDDNGKLPNKPMRHGYWGPCFDDEAIESALRTYKLRYTRLAGSAQPRQSCFRREKFSVGFRSAWSSARGRWEADDSGRSARSGNERQGQ